MQEFLPQYFNLTWIYWILAIAYGVTILSIVAVVISENRNPVKSLGWITVLLALPAIGIILYLLFGRSIKGKRYISRRNRRKLKKHEKGSPFIPSQSDLSDESAQEIKLGQALTGAPFYEGNNAQVFDNGYENFSHLAEDIQRAEKYIYLQFYIIASDDTGNRIADLLIEKARQGLDIKIIYDYIGSVKTKYSLFVRMKNAGIDVRPFFKVTLFSIGGRLNWRNHRKICVIDGKIGYIGGMNIANRYVTGGKFPMWRDLHLRVEGPILRSLNHSFAYDWNFMGQPLPAGLSMCDPTAQPENIGMQLVTAGPTNQWHNIGLVFLKAIGNAKRSIFIQTPYFLPTEGLLRALQAAALSNIDVRIMMPRRSDSVLLTHASNSYIKDCLRSGIKVYFFEAGMLHSKMIVIDDEFSTVGSSNFDFRSFEHNFESNLFIYSKEFNQRMKAQFYKDMENSTRILPYEWDHRRPLLKAYDSIMRLFAPIL